MSKGGEPRYGNVTGGMGGGEWSCESFVCYLVFLFLYFMVFSMIRECQIALCGQSAMLVAMLAILVDCSGRYAAR